MWLKINGKTIEDIFSENSEKKQACDWKKCCKNNEKRSNNNEKSC